VWGLFFSHHVRFGISRDRLKAPRVALSVGAIARLAEAEEPERTRSEARGRRGLRPREMALIEAGGQVLLLKRAALSRSSGQWSDDDFDVLANGAVVGRIFKANAAPVSMSWM